MGDKVVVNQKSVVCTCVCAVAASAACAYIFFRDLHLPPPWPTLRVSLSSVFVTPVPVSAVRPCADDPTAAVCSVLCHSPAAVQLASGQQQACCPWSHGQEDGAMAHHTSCARRSLLWWPLRFCASCGGATPATVAPAVSPDTHVNYRTVQRPAPRLERARTPGVMGRRGNPSKPNIYSGCALPSAGSTGTGADKRRTHRCSQAQGAQAQSSAGCAGAQAQAQPSAGRAGAAKRRARRRSHGNRPHEHTRRHEHRPHERAGTGRAAKRRARRRTGTVTATSTATSTGCTGAAACAQPHVWVAPRESYL